MRLTGKTVIVTGAARGLGRACALRFAEEGADLLLLDITQDLADVPYPLGSSSQLEHTAALCRRAGAAAVTAAVDVRDSEQCALAVDQALDRFGTVDVLVNNAGIASPSGKVTHDITEREWSLMLDVDLSGAWRMMKAVAPVMVQRRSGSIINVSSTAGTVGYRHFASYVAAKHGLIGLTKAAALDYAPMRVRVNALCPGSVRDEPVMEGRMLAEIARSLDVPVAEHEQIFVRDQPMNALIEPSDIANAALWLAADESRQVTGSVLTVDGGFTSR
ncbi:SDR family oxidoreductase [Kitasatospora viridis]|uniref:NAD(P)-dependent dehydrogenase (Short-subunit alcohol dehydrogenase family) n=1 Tax=Kitasatospora viridis TaxID=281105 RepID=A0A561UIR5_9ACTN|nr:SDR family oxidoreductase [Kitasatospora viridis]TWF99239.1 NAD(P)-dependent dehydrogenase (short-subunit alcohol dehydrogenase family) [Kitasatospora viridis]